MPVTLFSPLPTPALPIRAPFDNSSGLSHSPRRPIRSVEGMDIIRSKIGVCPQFDILWDLLTAREHLALFGTIRGIPRHELFQECSRRLDQVKGHNGTLPQTPRSTLVATLFPAKFARLMRFVLVSPAIRSTCRSLQTSSLLPSAEA